MQEAAMKVNSRHINISNPDKILFPNDDYTKMDLIHYYKKIAKYILPHLKNRPLTMHQFPDGIEETGFFHKRIADHYPGWINRVQVKKEDGNLVMPVCNDKASLVYFANLAMITPHLWLSHSDKPNKPDRIIFDLDPPKNNFGLVLKGAGRLRELLEDKLDLSTFVMTTGSKGLHVVVPIRRTHAYEEVRDFAKTVAGRLSSEHSAEFTTEVRKDKRKERLFIDYLRNAYAQTGVSPYGVRARDGAPVATPLHWKEVEDPQLTADKYHIKNVLQRLGHTPDPWKDFFKVKNELANAIGAME